MHHIQVRAGPFYCLPAQNTRMKRGSSQRPTLTHGAHVPVWIPSWPPLGDNGHSMGEPCVSRVRCLLQ